MLKCIVKDSSMDFYVDTVKLNFFSDVSSDLKL